MIEAIFLLMILVTTIILGIGIRYFKAIDKNYIGFTRPKVSINIKKIEKALNENK